MLWHFAPARRQHTRSIIVANHEPHWGITMKLYDSNLGGFLVATVELSSHAAKAGLQPGDVITSIDGTPVSRHVADELISTKMKTRSAHRVLDIVTAEARQAEKIAKRIELCKVAAFIILMIAGCLGMMIILVWASSWASSAGPLAGSPSTRTTSKAALLSTKRMSKRASNATSFVYAGRKRRAQARNAGTNATRKIMEQPERRGNTCSKGSLFGKDTSEFGNCVVLRNVTLHPCDPLSYSFSRAKGCTCQTWLKIVNEDLDTVRSLRRQLGGCNPTWFPQRGDRHYQLAIGEPVHASQGAHAPMADPSEVVFLIDAFGLGSIYHANVDVLFPLATTARAVLGGGFDVCVSGKFKCRAYILQGSPPAAEYWSSGSAAFRYNQAMQRLVLGAPIERVTKIPRAHYARVVVGWLSLAQPVTYPNTYLESMRPARPMERRLWSEFSQFLRSSLRLSTALDASSSAYGVWLRRSADKVRDQGAIRSIGGAHFHTLLAHACSAEPLRPGVSSTAGGFPTHQRTCWLTPLGLSRMPFLEQARALRNARLVAGMEGAGFVNQLFMPPNGIMVIVNEVGRGGGEQDAHTGNIIFQWGVGQYLERDLIYVGVRPKESNGTRQLSHPIAGQVGDLLRLAWLEGVASVCSLADERQTALTSLEVYTSPNCSDHWGYRARRRHGRSLAASARPHVRGFHVSPLAARPPPQYIAAGKGDVDTVRRGDVGTLQKNMALEEYLRKTRQVFSRQHSSADKQVNVAMDGEPVIIDCEDISNVHPDRMPLQSAS